MKDAARLFTWRSKADWICSHAARHHTSRVPKVARVSIVVVAQHRILIVDLLDWVTGPRKIEKHLITNITSISPHPPGFVRGVQSRKGRFHGALPIAEIVRRISRTGTPTFVAFIDLSETVLSLMSEPHMFTHTAISRLHCGPESRRTPYAEACLKF
jgi:hypothetical protein